MSFVQCVHQCHMKLHALKYNYIPTMVLFQEMTKQKDMLQISCKAELEKKSVSILISVCVYGHLTTCSFLLACFHEM